MKEIELTQGFVALVDDDDFEWLSQYSWHLHSGGYAQGFTRESKGKWKKFKMHRFILGIYDDRMIDHINGNKLDNRRSNLRVCQNPNQNRYNVPKRSHNTSGYKGVSWNKSKKKFVAQIQINKKGKHIGYFQDAVSAAIAYDQTAKKLFGEFAFLNFGESL